MTIDDHRAYCRHVVYVPSQPEGERLVAIPRDQYLDDDIAVLVLSTGYLITLPNNTPVVLCEVDDDRVCIDTK